MVLGCFGLVLLTVNSAPDHAKIWSFAALYSLIFLCVFGFSSIAGYGIRVLLWSRAVRHESMRAAHRQAVLFGFMSVAILMLQAGKVFNSWSAALLFLIFILLELYIQ